jgi:3-methylcrotonyl-CoA carboxylase alpha subunit
MMLNQRLYQILKLRNTRRSVLLCNYVNGVRLRKAKYTTVETPRLLTKILIANRGEIACRIIRTARRLGIRTVAVYSDADRDAMHVRMADEAYHIGPAPAIESYLRGDVIIATAKRAGAQAIHPGYGFLSENANFAAAVRQAGLIFVGPPAEAIAQMGTKSAAKTIMSNANVPVVPGYHGEDQSNERLVREAEKIGFPVMIKPVKGGGGKGMKTAWSRDEMIPLLESSRREAKSAFGSEGLLVEKYLQRPRHIEFQIFGDNFDNYVYLFERDCSLQRRHQKVIEEAPSPGLDETLRRQMGECAVNAARAVGYRGAGTVEFIFDTESQSFYFMEMNTRLQVEHPVTEMITGVDLVEWQLRVASGDRLPLTQDKLRITGHAFEARIYAENPNRDFLPSTGRLIVHRPPTGLNVRVDTGVEEGSVVSMFYDPMIAKLIVHSAESREDARRRLVHALEHYRIVGLHHNIPFLINVLRHPEFIKGNVETNFIEKYKAELISREKQHATLSPHCLSIVSLFQVLKEQNDAARHRRTESDFPSPWAACDGFRLNHQHTRLMEWQSGDAAAPVKQTTYVTYKRDGSIDIDIDNKGTSTKVLSLRGQLCEENNSSNADVRRWELQCEVNGTRERVHVVEWCPGEGQPPSYHFIGTTDSWHVSPVVAQFETTAHSQAVGSSLRSPMPGKVIKVLVKVGDVVETGQSLLILEAMKMEHTIKAPVKGRVKEILYGPGDLVEESKLLVTLAPVDK